MFLSATSFVTPVIVVVLCYSSVLKTARRKAREEPRVTVGRFSGSNVKPGTSSTEEAFDKNCDNSGKYVRGNENHVFISNSKKRWEKSVFEECYIGPEKSESTSLKMEEHHDEIERDSELSSTSTIRKKETKRKSSSRVVPSSTSGVAQLNTVVAAKGCSKMAGKGKHPKNFSTSSSRRTGTSRVNRVDVAAPVINRWTEDISLRKESTVIPEETEGKRYPLSRTITATAGLPEPLARMRGWMNERKKGDGRHKRQVLNQLLQLLSWSVDKPLFLFVTFPVPLVCYLPCAPFLSPSIKLSFVVAEGKGSSCVFQLWNNFKSSTEKELVFQPISRKNGQMVPPSHPVIFDLRSPTVRNKHFIFNVFFRKEMKITFILLVVNGTFLLCWFPHFIGMMCLTFTNGLCPFPDSYHIITTTLAMLNSGCNPFIYTLTYRKFRSGFQAVIPCFRSHNAAELENSVD